MNYFRAVMKLNEMRESELCVVFLLDKMVSLIRAVYPGDKEEKEFE